MAYIGDAAGDAKRKAREKHRKKKEEERRQQEEQRRAREALRPSNPLQVSNENDGYSRVYGEHGWHWIKVDTNANTASAPLKNAGETRQIVNGEVARPPAARRSLDNDFLSPQAPRAETSLLNRPSGPVSYISNTVSSSPLSDVTCSQSPSKAAAKRTVTFTKQEKLDPMAIMRMIEAKKDSKPKAKVADSPSVESNSSMQNGAAVAKDDMHEDPLEVQRRLSRERDAKAPPKDPLEIACMKEEEKRAKQKEESESEEEEESSVSEKEEETRPRQARNPLALMERNNQGRRSFSPQGGDNEAWPQGRTANLWDDSEDEYSNAATNKRKPAAARKAAPKKSGETRKAAPKKKGSLKAASRRCSYEDIGDIDSDSEQEETLIPTFNNPKLGPPSALEPLKLPRGKDQKTSHEVPASINRYLRGYQQHGVTFLYSSIMRGSGAILGDDMGLVSGKIDTKRQSRRRLLTLFFLFACCIVIRGRPVSE